MILVAVEYSVSGMLNKIQIDSACLFLIRYLADFKDMSRSAALRAQVERHFFPNVARVSS
jgi:hypothetical protein